MEKNSSRLDVSWQWSAFDALSLTDLYAILNARQEVFAVEQNCAYLDADGIDQKSWHFIGWIDNQGKRELAAYLRVPHPGVKYAELSIGRVLTTKVARGTGLGQELMRWALKKIEEKYPGQAIRISAQQYLERFYGGFGFKTVSAPYLEDNIPHVEMLRAA